MTRDLLAYRSCGAAVYGIIHAGGVLIGTVLYVGFHIRSYLEHVGAERLAYAASYAAVLIYFQWHFLASFWF
jgi:hypothetical protein